MNVKDITTRLASAAAKRSLAKLAPPAHVAHGGH